MQIKGMLGIRPRRRPDPLVSALLVERQLAALVGGPLADFGYLGAHFANDLLDGAAGRKIAARRL
jgi:hypothetical protein